MIHPSTNHINQENGMDNEATAAPQVDVEDISIEELAEQSGALSVGSASCAGTISTPATIGTAACIGCGG